MLVARLAGDYYNMKKVFISTPAYEGKVYVQYALSLVDTCTLLLQNNYEPVIRIPTGGSLLVADRNRIIQAFWESECDYLLCLDSDLGWDPRAVIKLLKSGKDFTGGVYPTRQGRGFTFRPTTDESGKIDMCSTTKLLKMEYIPAGFMLLTRKAIKQMREHFQHLYYCPKGSTNPLEAGYCLFDTEVWQGEFWGEDYVFCRRAREAGLDIWVDPLINFDHAGIRGALIEVLTNKPPEEQNVDTSKLD